MSTTRSTSPAREPRASSARSDGLVLQRQAGVDEDRARARAAARVLGNVVMPTTGRSVAQAPVLVEGLRRAVLGQHLDGVRPRR